MGNLDIFGEQPKPQTSASVPPPNPPSGGDTLTSDPLPPVSPSISNRGKAWKLLGATVVIVALIGLVVPKLSGMISGAPDFPGPGSGSVRIEINDGDTIARIGNTLKDAGVVKSVDAFISAASDNPESAKISAGLYNMKLEMSADGAVLALLGPATKVVDNVVIPEGKRASWIYEELSKATGISVTEFEAAAATGDELGLPSYAGGNVEGFLFPATYEFAPGASAAEILGAMIAKFNSEAARLDLESKAKEIGRTPYEIVIVASLLEVEGHPRDFAKVARVVYNRLAEPMRLQFDSTVNYGLGKTDVILTTDLLNKDTPYNMYLHDGLTPTPIDNPGAAAIEAALNPESGDWLYFITTDLNTQETKFTRSYDEFLVFKDEFLAFCDANPGTCW